MLLKKQVISKRSNRQMIDNQYILIDADDTLWENESDFRNAENRFMDLLAPHADIDGIREMLWKGQEDNIPYFGYGSKTYLISMLDAAITLCSGKITHEMYLKLKQIVTELAFHPLSIHEGVEETLADISKRHRLIMATKGDSVEQLDKARRSGLLKYFFTTEVMPFKNNDDYLNIADKYGIKPNELVMVGNSIRSDIIPIIELGGKAIYVPSKDIWAHEIAPFPESERAIELNCFVELKNFM